MQISAQTWMNLENMMLREKSNTKVHMMFSFIYLCGQSHGYRQQISSSEELVVRGGRKSFLGSLLKEGLVLPGVIKGFLLCEK